MTYPKRRTVAAAAAIFTVAFLAGSGAPPRLSATRSAPTAASTAQAMDDYLTGLLDSEHFLGAVVVARGTDVLLSKGYGRADTSTAAPNTPHTRFRIGSRVPVRHTLPRRLGTNHH
jgi:CubicO group peptidase (beta-lactamase class C family)